MLEVVFTIVLKGENMKNNDKKETCTRFNIRLDEETANFYRLRAQHHRMNISEYLRRLLIHGVITENVHEIETRLRSLITEAGLNHGSSSQGGLTDEERFSLYFCEEVLSKIVEDKSVQRLYEVRDNVKKRLCRMKEEEGV